MRADDREHAAGVSIIALEEIVGRRVQRFDAREEFAISHLAAEVAPELSMGFSQGL
jgi:hypothetical protein